MASNCPTCGSDRPSERRWIKVNLEVSRGTLCDNSAFHKPVAQHSCPGVNATHAGGLLRCGECDGQRQGHRPECNLHGEMDCGICYGDEQRQEAHSHGPEGCCDALCAEEAEQAHRQRPAAKVESEVERDLTLVHADVCLCPPIGIGSACAEVRGIMRTAIAAERADAARQARVEVAETVRGCIGLSSLREFDAYLARLKDNLDKFNKETEP